jgi:ubiquinone/menaquinone biosynthesis C-methylase UbiE
MRLTSPTGKSFPLGIGTTTILILSRQSSVRKKSGGTNTVQEDLVRVFYDKQAELEWQRLDRHRMEFAVSTRLLSTFLPPHGRILDCGGGPGRYALWLAGRGYDVTLFDLSEACLAKAQVEARERRLDLSYEQGAATDLSRFGDASFDAVFVMGPLYHLLELTERRRALAEAVRVTRPGGLVAASVITRMAVLRCVAKEEAGRVLELYAPMLNVMRQGYDPTWPPPDDDHVRAYFADPAEVEPLLRGAGLAPLGIFAVEGFVSMIDEDVHTLQGADWEAWVELNLEFASNPTLFSGAEHLLAFGRKPQVFSRSLASSVHYDKLTDVPHSG